MYFILLVLLHYLAHSSSIYQRLLLVVVALRPSVPLIRLVPTAFFPDRPAIEPLSLNRAPEIRSPIVGLRRWVTGAAVAPRCLRPVRRVVVVVVVRRGRVRRAKRLGLRVRVVLTGVVLVVCLIVKVVLSIGICFYLCECMYVLVLRNVFDAGGKRRNAAERDR
jgi:hypothetical protein